MSTMKEIEYSCLICGMKFKSNTQCSYSVFGHNLDTRPFGAAVIPNPIHKCPKCSFVFPDKGFFTKKDIAKIKNALKTNNIFEKESNMPKYYYLAKEVEIAGKSLKNIAYWFLSAVWENYDFDKQSELINITIEYIDKTKKTNKDYNNYQLIKLDLLRRSSQFDAAMELIEKIKKDKNFCKDFIVKIIDLQIKLIGEKNQEEHSLPER